MQMDRRQGIHLKMRHALVVLGTMISLAGCQGAGGPVASSSPSPASAPGVAGSPPPLPSPESPGGGKTQIRAKKGPAWVLDAMKVVWNDPEHKARVEKVDWSLPAPGGGPGVRVQADGAW